MPLQTLFDDLAGAAGSPVNRPQLNAFVANSQATNALRSAETEDAIQRAAQAVDQQTARQRLGDLFANAKDGAGNPLYTPTQAQLLGDEAMANMGDAAKLGQGALEGEQSGANLILGNPAYLNTPAATTAQQVRTGKIAGPTAVPAEYSTPAGVAPPNVQETPGGQAKIDSEEAIAGLHNAQATNPSAFHESFQQLDPQHQTMLTTLLQQGAIGPNQLYAIGRNPSLIDAIYAAQTGSGTGIAGLESAKQAVRKNFASGQDGQTLQRLNTAIGHLSLMPQAVAALQNGNYQVLNGLFQGFQAQTGAAPPVVFNALKGFLAKEVLSAVQGSGRSALRDRQEVQGDFSRINSPDQLLGVANLVAPLLGSRAGSMEQQYVGTMSLGQPGSEDRFRSEFRNNFLLPRTREVLGMGTAGFGFGAPGAGPAAGGPAPAGPPAAAAPPAVAPPGAPPNALAYLKAHPELAPQFKAKYGYVPGS